MSEDILDLDVIVPEPKKIRFGGEIITVNPPKMGDLMALFKLSEKQKDIKETDRDYEQIIADTTEIIFRMIPELAGKELNILQILELETLIAKMGTPELPEDLKALGIEIDTEKKIPDSLDT